MLASFVIYGGENFLAFVTEMEIGPTIAVTSGKRWQFLSTSRSRPTWGNTPNGNSRRELLGGCADAV
jgi:hypothetical protein